MTSFNLINKSKWQKIIKEIAFDEIKILGPDLLIQTKLNLSIQMPGDTSSLLPAHSDTWSSDSPFQLNLWIHSQILIRRILCLCLLKKKH